MHFLAHTDTVWHRGPPSPPDDFISFGDLAAYEADRHTGKSASSFMTLFARNILSGTFDAEPLGLIPFVDLMTIDQTRLHMQIPYIGFLPDNPQNQSGGMPAFLGYGSANSDGVIAQLALVNQCIENAEARTTSEELQALASDLNKQDFDAYPDSIQGYFNDILIAKDILRHWYRMRGFTTPWSAASNDNAKASTSTGKKQAPRKRKRGRPRRSAWDFIEERSREMKKADETLYNKVIAARVLNEAANDFCKTDLPAESTVIKDMGRILKGL